MCVLTMKSMTNALRAKGVLQSRGIIADVMHLDPSVTARGCAYGIAFACSDTNDLRRILDDKGIEYGEWIGGGLHGLPR
jgi:hypothetical protein